MHDIALIDPKTASREGMTPLEAQAVVELWLLRQRLKSEAEGAPFPLSVEAQEAIPAKEVRKLLRTVRATFPVTARTPRPLITDVRLAIAVVLAFLVIVGAIGASFYSSRRQSVPWARSAVDSVSQDSWGMTVMRYRYSLPLLWERTYTQNPERFAFAKDSTLYMPINDMGAGTTDAQLRSAIKNVVGGPLAERSSLARRAVPADELQRILDSGPLGANEVRIFPPGETPTPSRIDGGQLIEWKEVSAAFGGKTVSSQFPYAIASDEANRKAVQQKQAELIEQLLKAATAYSRK